MCFQYFVGPTESKEPAPDSKVDSLMISWDFRFFGGLEVGEELSELMEVIEWIDLWEFSANFTCDLRSSDDE